MNGPHARMPHEQTSSVQMQWHAVRFHSGRERPHRVGPWPNLRQARLAPQQVRSLAMFTVIRFAWLRLILSEQLGRRFAASSNFMPQTGITRPPDLLRLGKELAHSSELRGLSEQALRRLGEAFNARLLQQFKQWGD